MPKRSRCRMQSLHQRGVMSFGKYYARNARAICTQVLTSHTPPNHTCHDHSHQNCPRFSTRKHKKWSVDYSKWDHFDSESDNDERACFGVRSRHIVASPRFAICCALAVFCVLAEATTVPASLHGPESEVLAAESCEELSLSDIVRALGRCMSAFREP